MNATAPPASATSSMAAIRAAIREAASRGDYVLANARIPGASAPEEAGWNALQRADLHITGARFAAAASASQGRAQAGESPSRPAVIDLGGRMVLPPFVDCHTHLDKGHILPRMPRTDGTLATAIATTAADRPGWTHADLRRRMDFALRCACHHGTSALRTHIDSQPGQYRISWDVFEALQQEWQGRVALQGASLFSIEFVRDEAFFRAVCARVAQAGGVIGAVVFPLPDVGTLLARMFAAASDHGLALDFHADETGDAASNMLALIAQTALAHGKSPPVLVGHCCSLANQPEDTRRRTLDMVARAGIGVVSLPFCNLYLQDRRHDGTTPRWRGTTPVHELRGHGIPVALASDNTRDPFHPFGDLDMLDAFRMGVRLMHLDRNPGDWISTVTSTPAMMMGMTGTSLEPGFTADCIVMEGRDWSEALARPQGARIVVRAGKPVDAPLPDYAELDMPL